MVETLGEVLPYAARRYGGKTALVSDGARFTFSDLEAKSNAFANGLVAAGIKPGDTVTLYGPNSWQWLVAYYAIAKTGAVVNPVNVMLTPEEVGFIIGDCGARAVVASADKAAALMDMRGNAGLSEVVIWGDKAPAGVTPFDRWLEQGKPAFTPVERSPKDAGAICYTSGTTGHPKGAVQSHRSIVATAKGTALMHSRSSADTVVSPLPAPHVYGSCVLNAGVLAGCHFGDAAALQRGGRARCHPDAPRHHVRLRADRLLLPARPPEIRELRPVLADALHGRRPDAARRQVAGVERAHGRAGAGAVGHDGAGGSRHLQSLLGRQQAGHHRPADAGHALQDRGRRRCRDRRWPPGERGELMIKGPLVMDGYAGNDQATKETVRADGWMHTGDIATSDEDGYYTIVDRKKDMILTAGYNVYPAELERVLCMHASVALAAVCGVADEAKGELAKAYVMLKPGASASGKELVEHCRQHLAAYKLPRAVQFVASVPITPSGKIMRRLLKDVDDGTRAAGEQRQTRGA